MGNNYFYGLLITTMFLFVFSGQVAADDIIQLKNGKEIAGKVIEVTAEAVTVKLDEGILRIRRDRVKVIRKDMAIQPSKPTPLGSGGVSPEAPDKGPAQKIIDEKNLPAKLPELDADKEKKDKAPDAETLTPDQSAKSPQSVAKAEVEPEGTDKTVMALLERFLFLPENNSNRISIGMAVFFLFAMMIHLSAKLSDLEDLTVPRSLAFTLVVVSMALIQLAIMRTFSLPMLLGCLAVDAVVWYSGTRLILKEGFWRSTIMLCFFLLAIMVGVLWIEIIHFLLDM